MADKSTMQDHIEDLMAEISRLRADRDRFAKHIEDLMVELRRVNTELANRNV